MSKTKIPPSVKRELWFKAHGRCEFNGCNKRLDLHGVTFEKCDLSNCAHIIADSSMGPRGDIELSALLAKDEKNIMLMCPECHKYIDHEGKDKYSVPQLKLMKKQHEDRIDMLANISPNLKTLVVLYGANIGFDTPRIEICDVYDAIIPNRYPDQNKPISIDFKNSSFYESDYDYWAIESRQIIKKCKTDVFERLESEKIPHISLFAFSPQPLLVKLGTILNDKYNVDVYQKHRNSNNWVWQNEVESNPISIIIPPDTNKNPVLVFALSSDTIIGRVQERFGDNASIWIVTCSKPNNDMLKSKSQIVDFQTKVRDLMNAIETQTSFDSLNIFMAMPIAMAVELGRLRMEKANLKWVLYDYKREYKNDVKSITIINNE